MGSPYLKEQTTTLSERFSVPKQHLSLLVKDTDLLAGTGDFLVVNYGKTSKIEGADSKPSCLQEQVSILYLFRETKSAGFTQTSFKFCANGEDYSQIEEMNSQGTRRKELEKRIVGSLRACLPGYVIRLLPKSD